MFNTKREALKWFFWFYGADFTVSLTIGQIVDKWEQNGSPLPDYPTSDRKLHKFFNDITEDFVTLYIKYCEFSKNKNERKVLIGKLESVANIINTGRNFYLY